MILRIAYLSALTVLGLVVLSTCQNAKQQNKQDDSIVEKYQALALLQNNCFSCHNPDLNTEVRIAPPMFKIREHYLADSISKENFLKNIVQFVNDPTEENSIMPGAVRNFGVMPKQHINQEDLKIIAAYIFDNDLSSDEWDKEWETFKKQAKTENKNLSDIEIGQNIANSTKLQLGKNLLEAIQKYGTAGAVEFCNTRAIPITDSMSGLLNVRISRISDKPRNPLNTANNAELEIINSYKNKLKNKQPLEPKLIEWQNTLTGYYPIQTNKMCLQCHGQKNVNINPDAYSKIKKLYPDDNATGYGENELRGLFKIEMSKKQTKK